MNKYDCTIDQELAGAAAQIVGTWEESYFGFDVTHLRRRP